MRPGPLVRVVDLGDVNRTVDDEPYTEICDDYVDGHAGINILVGLFIGSPPSIFLLHRSGTVKTGN